jgi:thymidylate synthase
MKQYIDLITAILKEGRTKTDRTGTGTISIFGHQSVYYMKDGFPLLTLKKTYTNGVIHELLWFLNAMPEKYKIFGNTNIKYLVDNNVHIWDEWAYAKYKKICSNLLRPVDQLHIIDISSESFRIMSQEEFIERIKIDEKFALDYGDLGPVYGKQWINCGKTEIPANPWNNGIIEGINQIQVVIDTLKNRPDDRGIIVSAWQVNELNEMALRPCHTLFQFITEPLTFEERMNIFIKDGHDILELGVVGTGRTEEQIQELLSSETFKIPRFRLSLQLYQRSADTFLGVPFNIASFAMLLDMVAQVVNMIPYKFVHTFGDLHLYLNHKNQVNELLNRTRELNSEIIDFYSLSKEEIDRSIGNYYGPPLPKLKLNPEITNIFDFRIDDIKIIDYNPLSAIKAPVAV